MADRSPSIVGVSWTFASLSLLVVGLRLYTRCFVTRRAGWDDFFIALSLASAVVCSALAQVAVNYGLGRHTDDIEDPYDRIQAVKYTVIAPNFSIVSTTTGKISVVIFLLRLMGPSASPARRWFLYILSVVSVIWNALAIVVVMGFCRPAKKIWIPETPGTCFSLQLQLIVGISQAAFNAFADLILAIFPLFIFWRVKLPLVKRAAIVAILGAGIFAAAATLVKCILLKNLPEHADITWSWAPITTWYTIEMYVIIICATLPTLPQSFSTLMGRKDSTYYYKSSNHRSGKSDRNQTPIKLQRRPVDASLFETYVEERRSEHSGSSRENILDRNAPGRIKIQKTTEVRVTEEDRPAGEEEDEQYFPGQNPFRSSREPHAR